MSFLNKIFKKKQDNLNDIKQEIKPTGLENTIPDKLNDNQNTDNSKNQIDQSKEKVVDMSAFDPTKGFDVPDTPMPQDFHKPLDVKEDEPKADEEKSNVDIEDLDKRLAKIEKVLKENGVLI